MNDIKREALFNDLARFYHLRLHKSAKTWFCGSDRTFAEETIQLLESNGWEIEAAREDNRST